MLTDFITIFSWRIKQVLDFCFLMLYAQPKAMYYLQVRSWYILYNLKWKDYILLPSFDSFFLVVFLHLTFVFRKYSLY